MSLELARLEALPAVDAAWFRMDEPRNPMIVTAVLWFDGPLDLPLLRRIVQDELIGRFPRFSQRVVRSRGRLCFEPYPIDLDRHLVVAALPAPGGQAELERFVSDRMSEPLPDDRPLWSFSVLDGYLGGWALVVRVHHGLADGFALASVLLSLTEPRGTPPFAHHPPPPGARRLDRGVRALAKLILAVPDPRTALRRPLGTHKVAVWSRSWPLASVKAAAAARGVTINDLLMAALAGALRTWLVTQGGPLRRIRAFVPVDMRPPGQPVAPGLGNRFGLVYLPLPVEIDDAAGRLAATRAAMDAIKASPEAAVSLGIIDVIGRMPSVVEDAALWVLGMKGSLVATNVPGPKERVRLAGSPLAGMRFWVPQAARIGLGVSILSYAGEVGIGVAGDAGVVPDPRTIAEAFAAELERLL